MHGTTMDMNMSNDYDDRNESFGFCAVLKRGLLFSKRDWVM